MYVFVSKDKTEVKSFLAANIRLALIKFHNSTRTFTKDFLETYGTWLCYSESNNSDLRFIDTVENLF